MNAPLPHDVAEAANERTPTALTDAISVLVCVDAERRRVENNAMAMRDRDRVMRAISMPEAAVLIGALNEALDIIGQRQ